MHLDQHIAELKAELAHCLFSQRERAAITAELKTALVERAKHELAAPEPSGATEPGRAAA